MTDISYPMHVAIIVQSPEELRGVYAVLAGLGVTSVAAAVTGNVGGAKQGTTLSSGGTSSQENLASVGTGETATIAASPSDGELDAAGWPWSPDMHASTKTKTGDGLWRMKVGVKRPDPKPGFAPENTGTSNAGLDPKADAGASAQTPAATEAAGDEDEDEFAAFREAAAASENATARAYTDSDLGALCNQAATKLGNPDPIKALVAEYVPDGETKHSRNVPEAKRAAFVAAVEKAAGIKFAG